MSLYYLAFSPPVAHIATVELKGCYFSRLALICRTPEVIRAANWHIQTYATPDVDSLIRQAGDDLCPACRKALKAHTQTDEKDTTA